MNIQMRFLNEAMFSSFLFLVPVECRGNQGIRRVAFF